MTVNYISVSFGRVLELNISGCHQSCDKHFLGLKETILQVETSNVSWRTWELGYKENYRVYDQIPSGLFYIYKPEIQMPTSEKVLTDVSFDEDCELQPRLNPCIRRPIKPLFLSKHLACNTDLKKIKK